MNWKAISAVGVLFPAIIYLASIEYRLLQVERIDRLEKRLDGIEEVLTEILVEHRVAKALAERQPMEMLVPESILPDPEPNESIEDAKRWANDYMRMKQEAER